MDQGPAVLVIEKCNVHSFKLKNKKILNYGKCLLIKNDPQIILKVQGVIFPIGVNSLIVKLIEPEYVNYLTSSPDGNVVSFSFKEKETQIMKFEQLLSMYKVNIVAYNSPDLNPQVKETIDSHCPVENLSIGKTQVGQEIGNSIGAVFGAISGALEISKINQSSNQAVNRFSQENFSSETHSTWDKFKMKVSSWNDKASEKLEPVSKTVKEETTKLGVKFDKSDNAFIKGLRNFSQKVSSSLNEGYEKGENKKTETKNSYQPPPPKQKEEQINLDEPSPKPN